MRSDEEIECAEAKGAGVEGGGCNAGGIGSGCVGVVADGVELFAAATEEGSVRWVAEVLDCQAEAGCGGGLAELCGSDRLEELGAVAEEDGGGGDGIPENVTEAAKRRAVGGEIASQSAASDWLSGAPMRSRRCADCRIVPEYRAVIAMVAPGASGCGSVTTASSISPV